MIIITMVNKRHYNQELACLIGLAVKKAGLLHTRFWEEKQAKENKLERKECSTRYHIVTEEMKHPNPTPHKCLNSIKKTKKNTDEKALAILGQPWLVEGGT
ncbi:hypothetical protein SAY86_017287 [Trapa natans]|uniref:Uncharacterized protein n=1 Tax=Trapa natans TaxID=22666 RepID=A0AAN7M198_TRANT|nr:hypothetical protein SAY86_017287 [Trapa natans]